MNSVKNSPNKADWRESYLRDCLIDLSVFILSIALGCALLSHVTGCARTVTPVIPKATQASYDGNAQNSGLIGFDAAGSAIITPHARDRYNGLASDYGSDFKPPVHPDDGITQTTTNTYLIDAQHLVYFATMNRWRKEGKPTTP